MFFLMTTDKSAENILRKFLFCVLLRELGKVLAAVLCEDTAVGDALGFVKRRLLLFQLNLWYRRCTSDQVAP
jgi:hypothetical protein